MLISYHLHAGRPTGKSTRGIACAVRQPGRTGSVERYPLWFPRAPKSVLKSASASQSRSTSGSTPRFPTPAPRTRSWDSALARTCGTSGRCGRRVVFRPQIRRTWPTWPTRVTCVTCVTCRTVRQVGQSDRSDKSDASDFKRGHVYLPHAWSHVSRTTFTDPTPWCPPPRSTRTCTRTYPRITGFSRTRSSWGARDEFA